MAIRCPASPTAWQSNAHRSRAPIDQRFRPWTACPSRRSMLGAHRMLAGSCTAVVLCSPASARMSASSSLGVPYDFRAHSAPQIRRVPIWKFSLDVPVTATNWYQARRLGANRAEPLVLHHAEHRRPALSRGTSPEGGDLVRQRGRPPDVPVAPVMTATAPSLIWATKAHGFATS